MGLRESEEERASKIVLEEGKRKGLTEKDFRQLGKNASVKVELARKVRKETAMTLEWIARELQMGSIANVAKAVKA